MKAARMAPLEDKFANPTDDILVHCAWPGPDLKQEIYGKALRN
jgi:hypothetical protein